VSRVMLVRLVTFAALIGFSARADTVVENWTANRNSYDVHATGPDKFVIESGPVGAGGNIAKFTVQPGDVFNKSTGERSEVVLGGWRDNSRFRVTGDEGREFYRVTVKLAPGWQAPQVNSRGYVWGTFFQLHGPNELASSPAIAMYADVRFSLFVLGGNINIPVSKVIGFSKSDLNIGEWVDFVLEVKWAQDSTGAIAVYRRDEGEKVWAKVADVDNLATMQYRGASILGSHYWKAGFYRSESSNVNSLWLGPILRGQTFKEVAGD